MKDRRQGGPILLLGAGGQTGHELRRTLSTLGTVVPLTRSDADLADLAQLRRVVRAHAPALIVNAAAYNAVDQAEEVPDQANAINAVAPGVLAEEARRLNAGLVHYSSDFVFGSSSSCGAGDDPRPLRENDPTEPMGAYGRSKLEGERAIRAAGAAHLIFRTSWVFSSRGRTFLASLLRLDLNRDEVAIVDDEQACPTWAPSLADATSQILAAGWARHGTDALHAEGGTYHLAGDGWCSRYVFAQAVFAHHVACGRTPPRLRPVSSAAFPALAKRPRFSALDTSLVREIFGITIPGWQQSIALCLAAEQPSS